MKNKIIVILKLEIHFKVQLMAMMMKTGKLLLVVWTEWNPTFELAISLKILFIDVIQGEYTYRLKT